MTIIFTILFYIGILILVYGITVLIFFKKTKSHSELIEPTVLSGKFLIKKLTDLPGIGNQKASNIVQKFRDENLIKKANLDELSSTPGISDTDAETIKDNFGSEISKPYTKEIFTKTGAASKGIKNIIFGLIISFISSFLMDSSDTSFSKKNDNTIKTTNEPQNNTIQNNLQYDDDNKDNSGKIRSGDY